MKLEVPEGWQKIVMDRTLIHIPRQYIDADKQFSPPNSGEGTLQTDLTIPWGLYESLLDYIAKNEHGIIKTDREEDLKLINRLLDILSKSIEVNKT